MSKRQQLFKQISRVSALSAGLLGTGLFGTGALGPTTASAAPTVEQALQLKPIQPNVNFQTVDEAEAANCKLQDIDREGWAGWEVVSPDGQILRRFADTNGDSRVDLWCYYRYGVEVYRDVDADFNGKADQYRWLGTEGIRWGLDDNEDMTIDRWKQISAEEVTAELIAALAAADAKRFTALLATEKELSASGLGKAKARDLAEKASLAARRFAKQAAAQKTIGPKTGWLQFAASPPGVVPAGTDGSTADIIVYENAVAMFENGGESGQLIVGTMIKIGDAWRLIDSPSLGESGDAIVQSGGHFFQASGGGEVTAGKVATSGPAMQKMVTALEAIDRRLAAEKDAKAIATLNARRADVVEELIAASVDAADKDMWTRQLIDTVGFAMQSGSYPDGLKRLKAARAKYAGRDRQLASYIDFQVLGTEYASRLTPQADSAKVQEWYLDQLTGFTEKYPQAAESAQAMLQLALGKEFENDEKEALGYYRQVVKSFPGTTAAGKAEGAIRRLDSIGKPVDLQGTSLDGKSFRLAALRGRPVIIQYWASWCEPCKEDMKQLRRLKAQYSKSDLEIVGVSIDSNRADAEGFVRANQMPWIQLFEEGGLDASPLAQQFGVQTLPTTLLVDSRGRLVGHYVTAGELTADLEKMSR